MRSNEVAVLTGLAAACVFACADARPPTRDKNTNWLQPCTSSAACNGGLECLTGVCTRACNGETECEEARADLACRSGVCLAAEDGPVPDAGSAGSGGTKPAPGGSGGSGPTPDAGTTKPVACDLPELSRAPGTPRYDASATGRGPCATTALSEVIAAIHAEHPELAEIRYVYDPDSPPPPIGGLSVIYAYDTDAGFALAFQGGSGDCESGCVNQEYWYFRTDDACAPVQVGHYLQPGGAPCDAEGFPLWDHPVPPSLPAACSTRSVPDTYTAVGCGEGSACSFGGEAKPEPVTLEVQLTLMPSAPGSDPSEVRFRLDGTGRELLDGRVLTGMLSGRKLAITTRVELPSSCLEQFTIEAVLDFDGGQASFLRYEETRTPDCSAGSGDYCKGQLQLDFGNLSAGSACVAVQDILAAVDREQAPLLACSSDADCSFVPLTTDCMSACSRAVRADRAAELEQAIEAAGAAYCPGATCGVSPQCAEVEPACRDGRCVVESVQR